MLKLQSSLKAICMAMAALTALSCSEDELAGKSALNGNTTIVASFEGAGINTRTSVNDVNEVVWNKDDAFGLFYTSSSQQTPTAAEFTCADADGTSTSASFMGTLSDGATTTYAVYPYKTGMSLSGNTVAMNLPKDFAYTQASNGPMYAPASDITGKIAFKHLAGLLKLTVSKGITSAAKKFVITADKNIAGNCTADLNGDNPVLAVTEDNGASKTITVNLDITDDSQGNITTFYIPIPVGTYATLSAKLLDNSEQELFPAKEWTNVTVARAGMLTASFGFVKIEASTESGVKDAIAAALPTEKPATETTTELQITGAINTGSTSGGAAQIANIEIPVLENSNVNLALTEIPVTTTSAPLVLKDDNTEVTESAPAVNTVTVAIPKVSTPEAAPNFTITMPQSTVALDATSAEGTTYGKVTAKTANNTLVIKKGVTVKDLVVAGGNVRVAGKIEAISKADGFTDVVYIIKEKGATIPSEPITGFTVIDAAAYDMKAAFAKGEDYTLTADANIIGATIIIPVGKTVTLDLNGHTVTADNSTYGSGRITVEGNFTLKDSQGNGQIIASEDWIDGSYDGGIITVSGNNAHMTMESGHIYAIRNDAPNKGQYGIILSNGGDFTMTGGKIEAGWFALSGNGKNTGESTIVITNGELVSTADYAIYLPHAGTTTISGGEITGACGGIGMRNGSLEINGNPKITSKGNGTTGNWKNGTGNTGNAVINVGCGTQNVYGNCTVTINGGTFTAEGNATVIEKQAAPQQERTIAIDIKGGTFSDPSALAYLTEEANVNVTLNKNYQTANINVPSNSQTINLDLNTKTLTLTSNTHNDLYGKVTISNGTIQQASGSEGALYAKSSGELTLDKVKVSGANYALSAQGPHVKLNVINGSEIHAEYFPISTNASISEDGTLTYGQNATITLSDSKFIGTETGFMNNVPAKVTITNCEFSGNHQAALLRGGDYTITNSKFTLNADLASSHSENKHLMAWSSGNKAAFAGLTIGNYKSTAYQYYTKVNMTKVTVTVSGTNASSFPAMHVCANNAQEKGVTMTYDAQSSFTSSFDPAIEYGTTNITVNNQSVIESDGKFIVPKAE